MDATPEQPKTARTIKEMRLVLFELEDRPVMNLNLALDGRVIGHLHHAVYEPGAQDSDLA